MSDTTRDDLAAVERLIKVQWAIDAHRAIKPEEFGGREEWALYHDMLERDSRRALDPAAAALERLGERVAVLERVAEAADHAQAVFWSFTDSELDHNLRRWTPHPDITRAMRDVRAAPAAAAALERLGERVRLLEQFISIWDALQALPEPYDETGTVAEHDAAVALEHRLHELRAALDAAAPRDPEAGP